MSCGKAPSKMSTLKAVKDALGKLNIKTLFGIPKIEAIESNITNKKAI
jgi:hypothetical protein